MAESTSGGVAGKEAKVKEMERRSYVLCRLPREKRCMEFRVQGCKSFSQMISGFYTFPNLQNDTNMLFTQTHHFLIFCHIGCIILCVCFFWPFGSNLCSILLLEPLIFPFAFPENENPPVWRTIVQLSASESATPCDSLRRAIVGNMILFPNLWSIVQFC